MFDFARVINRAVNSQGFRGFFWSPNSGWKEFHPSVIMGKMTRESFKPGGDYIETFGNASESQPRRIFALITCNQNRKDQCYISGRLSDILNKAMMRYIR